MLHMCVFCMCVFAGMIECINADTTAWLHLEFTKNQQSCQLDFLAQGGAI